MTTNLEDVFQQAMKLPDESKAVLAERIVEYLTTHIDPDLERLHIDIIRKRREELREGKVKPIPGEEALAKARRLLDR